MAVEQQRLAFRFRQCVGEAISKIQFGGMPAGFAEVAIGLARDASLRFGDRLNRDLRRFDQFIETAAGDRILAAIDHRPGFYVADGRDTTVRCLLNDLGELGRLRFGAENGDQSGGVENQLGKPFSS